ncbi:MAG: translocation/assembly module TamB domain-containing protein [Phenylobacterium sp.]|uniref:translocation/assembly module TamB domain-containing protein n=1 Tax=Phenylobacterium sp. TaxID=1871053 RepID=UPI001A615E63|nr:translocation/assembly module TamB domain-containing protein [Phenylobacterium sp.]MBL8772254.1 translocation/assembly module TamB domain-containing protein [Phenylobacterium sp.]
MSGADDTPATAPAPRRRLPLRRTVLLAALALLAVLAAVVASTRYGVLLPQVRHLIEARTDGLKIGRLGRLKVEGLSGDIWRDVRARRVTIRDEKGVWLEARDVHVTWRYLELFRRRFDADLIEAASVRVIRRPTLTPKGKDRGLPVSFDIDKATTRLILEPGFSYERGVYDVVLGLDIERLGGRRATLAAESVLHPGDHLDLDLALGGTGPLRVVAQAREARGGAIAGALGLPPDVPFRLDVRAGGTLSKGEFTATATSGARAPLVARGAWTPAGGQAGGRLQLGASELTRGLAQRLGEEVRFGLAGSRTAPGVFALDLKLRSEGLQVHAWGPGDLGKRRLSRVRLEADAPSLSRLVPGPEAGPARIAGVLDMSGADWAFEGSAAADDVALGGYGLARVSGPVALSRRRGAYDLEAGLTGAGGRGQGFVATFLGATPSVRLEAARLANGQQMLRRFDLSGRGLKVRASGGRSLLGALTLEGEADVSNLSEARLGASGGAKLSWRAAQARAEAPWTFRLDARGQGFAVGLAELDRLVGRTPRVQLEAGWQAGRLNVARASLSGAALEANVAGVMGGDRSLAFKADWTATGPLRAGPVEITGRVRGTGDVTGTVAQPRLELAASVPQLDVPRLPMTDARLLLTFERRPDGSSGAVALNASTAYGPASARSDFRFPRGGVDLTGLEVDAGGVKAAGSLSLRQSSPSAADLTLTITRGALIEAGRIAGTARITGAAGAARADLDLQGENLRWRGSDITVRSARIAADGPLARLPFGLDARGASGQGAWSVAGRGVLGEASPGYTLAFDGQGAIGARTLRTVETAAFRFGGPERTARVRLAGPDGGRLDLDGVWRGERANVTARVAAMGLDVFNADFDGRVDATLGLQGQGERLDGALEARLTDARGKGTPAVQGMDGTLQARLTGDTITMDVATANEQGLRASANLVLPAEAAAAPFRVAIARQRPMRGRFSAEGEVRPLFDILVGGDRALAGFVRTEGTLAGTLANPRATGQVSVERGRFDDGGTGLTLRDVVVRADFTEDSVNVTEARGVDGRGGQVSGQGRVSLAREGVSSFRLDLRGFRLIDNDIGTARASGQATINRGADGQVKLAGDLVIDEAEIAAEPPTPSGVVAMDVKEINRPADLAASLPPRVRRGDGWALDVKLRAPRRVFLRGRGLDVELSLDAHVGGTTARADLTGVARVVRGDYDFAGKRFEFDDRSLVYLSSRPQDIRLQLDATREDPSLTVTVRIRGTAARPEITLVSSPSLPDDEVLAKVLFERSASQLSGVEAAQLASALSALSGGGGFDVIGNLRTFAGLDRLAFGGDEQTGVTVSGGKYLTDDVYLELTGGGRSGPSAQVEWRISRSLSILSRLAQQTTRAGSGNRIAIRWRKDY